MGRLCASGEIQYTYSLSMEKLKKEYIADNPEENETRIYLGGVEFIDGIAEAYNFGDGRVLLKDTDIDYPQYYIKDHLGNAVVTFADKDGDFNIVTEEDSTDPEEIEVVQRNLYYPFGMQQNGCWKAETTPEMNYLYNGKEVEKDLGLDWAFYGFRMYDSSIGRFTGVDPIADKFAFVSGFNYAENRPVSGIDLHGLQYIDAKESFYSISQGQIWIKTENTHNGIDGYGQRYIGNVLPKSSVQISRSDGTTFPVFRGGLDGFNTIGDNLRSLYSATKKTKAGSLDRRLNSTKAYNQVSSGAGNIGKVGLALIAVDIAYTAYKDVNRYLDGVEAERQDEMIGNALNNVITALNRGMIDEQFQNTEDITSIANFVYQGEDNFGDNEDLRNTAIQISKTIAKNYKGMMKLLSLKVV